MLLYIIIFLIPVAILYNTLESDQKTQIAAASWFMLALGLFVGLADMLGGYDRYIYCELFDRMADDTRQGLNPWKSDSFEYYSTEFGYGTWCALLSYITMNRYIFIFISTILVYLLLIKSFKDYSDNVPMTIIIFLGLWFFFTFTYLRQVMGCAICALSYKYLMKRDYARFLIIWFIAYSFHNSAVLVLPLIFMPVKKLPRHIVINGMVVCLLIGLTPIPQAMFATYEVVNDARVVGGGYDVATGFRWAYLIEAVFFLWLILKNYDKINEKPKDVTFLNLALMMCAILLIFVKSENGGRLTWFLIVPMVCFLPKLLIKERKILRDGWIIIVVCFFLYYRVYNSWQGMMSALYPYKTFLSDGYRKWDPVHDEFEYDDQYDVDKFYRPAFWIFE